MNKYTLLWCIWIAIIAWFISYKLPTSTIDFVEWDNDPLTTKEYIEELEAIQKQKYDKAMQDMKSANKTAELLREKRDELLEDHGVKVIEETLVEEIVEVIVSEVEASESMYRHQHKNPLPKVYWNTPSKRLNNLLWYFWHTPSDYVEVRNTHWIPEELMACIIRADTWFVALKSQHNYGNVWNSDRGDVVSYNSRKDWLMAIGRVLNNRYLWPLATIWELSEWGRKELWLPSCKESWEFCYATSEYNWNMNVTDCMTFIHWRAIRENFIFRKAN